MIIVLQTLVFPGMVCGFRKPVENDNARFHKGVQLGGQDAIKLGSQMQKYE